MTPAQITTLKTIAQADLTAAGYMASADDQALADWFNAPDATYTVWRTNIRPDECAQVIVWTEVDALTAGKARIWEWMSKLPLLDASKTNIRQGISDAFSAAAATRTALTALAKRLATRAEKALATGIGTSAAPSIMTYEGLLSPADASLVRVA